MSAIEVSCTGTSMLRLRVGRRWHRVVRTLETWVIQGAWWQREERRLYARLQTDQGVIEVYCRQVNHAMPMWHLAQVID